METARSGYPGTGPGDITPDGCAVELYRRLPVDNEPAIVVDAFPPPASLLELGCGAGRLTRPLSALGYAVTAVDESAAMLAHVTGATRIVRSPVEGLALGEAYDVVLLASFLVNAPDPEVRRALLATCLRHVAPAGVVVIQREGDDWATARTSFERPMLDGTARIESTENDPDGVRSLRAEYAFPDATWTQTFRSRSLPGPEFERALAESGLRLDRYLDDERLWAAARPL